MQNTSHIENSYCTYDPSLDEEEINNPNPFPNKMAMALDFIEKHGLPPEVMQKKKTKKRSLVAQTKLLTTLAIEPTEQQMQELKAFLHQLFGEQLLKVEEEMVEC